ncbi:MAG: UbiA family prenyltransferase [Sphingobacteriales bacterium]|nr:MAG: UbiA family prenyltransferase [Sphingobacteriales bacterium]
MTNLLQISQSIFKTRIHVAVICFFLYHNIIYYYLNNNAEPIHLPVLLAFAIWNLALYLFDRAYDYNKDIITDAQDALSNRQARWGIKIALALTLFPIGLLLCFQYPVLPYLFFIPLTFLYTLPLTKHNIRVKNLFFIKNLYSAIFIWTLPLVVILRYYQGYPQSVPQLLFENYYFLVFVLMGEIIWDFKDVAADKAHKVQTLPVVLGFSTTRIILFLMLTVNCTLFYLQTGYINYPVVAFFLLFIFFAKETTPVWCYHLPLLLVIADNVWKFIKFRG